MPGKAGVAHPFPEALRRKLDQFYSYDGTWRTSEPSWRVKDIKKENVRGCPSQHMTLNDPSALNSLQRGRRHAPKPPASAPPGASKVQVSAQAAAQAFAALNFKDQKLSGFATETLRHTEPGPGDPMRWNRLGSNTRERLVAADRFGDVAINDSRPWTAPVGLFPATFPKMAPFAPPDAPPGVSAAEPSGFTRRPQLHKAVNLTGGFVYVEPSPPPPGAKGDVKVVGNKLPTGFAINNHDVAAEDATGAGDAMRAALPKTHYVRTTIGASGKSDNWYEGVGARVTKYGELRRRKLAPHETGGPVNTLRTETSGFTRNKLHERDHVRQKWQPPGVPEVTVERKLQASQIALRMMDNPIEYTQPHAHKMRRPATAVA